MTDRKNLYHVVFPFLLIPSCLLIIANYGWIGYAVLTDRPGLNGSLYYYYSLTQPQFYAYNFIIASIAVVLVAFQVKYLISNNVKDVARLFLVFAGFILLITVCEIYLSTRFTGKG
jgi:hypothetical protein